MRREDFSATFPGTLKEIGAGYLAFVPPPIPSSIEWSSDLARLLSAADRALGQLAGVGRTLANPHLLIRPFVNREAVLSSRIEGTRASLSDLFLFDAAPEAEPEVDDVREVSNYVRALEHGLERMDSLPIGQRLLCELHSELLRGTRGEQSAGELRRIQVWIGAPGARLADAIFVPPPANELTPLLSDLERFIHSEREDLPPLIRIALAHYQFEAIHPFHDGNGRLGRLLITLMLHQEKLLDVPLLYLSAYFERHRTEYYDRLREVSTRGARNEWLAFFLRGVAEQSTDAVVRASQLLDLRDEYHKRLHAARSSALVHKLIDELFVYPAVSVPRAAGILGVTYRSAQMNVLHLVKAGILREVTGRKRNRIFMADGVVHAIERA